MKKSLTIDDIVEDFECKMAKDHPQFADIKERAAKSFLLGSASSFTEDIYKAGKVINIGLDYRGSNT